MRTTAVPGSVVLSLLLSACSAGSQNTFPDPVIPTPAGSAVTSSAPPSAAPTATASSEPPFPATTAADTAEPSGEPLTVVAARVGAQEGYDRVVLELAGGDGRPGWSVQYTDDPRQQGSGKPVRVRGQATLSVLVRGVGYPFDTGVDEVSKDPELPPGLVAISDVRLGSTFEGQYEAFIGTTGRLPFRVFALADPARVVIDVRHS